MKDIFLNNNTGNRKFRGYTIWKEFSVEITRDSVVYDNISDCIGNGA